jgi:hypothetical protein
MVAVSVEKTSLLGGNFNSNLTNPGLIILGWYAYPGITLNDSSSIFIFGFNKNKAGTSPLSWFDDGSSCYYMSGSSTVLNDLPTSSFYVNGSVTFQSKAPVTIAPRVKALPGSMVDIPVKVNDFSGIGKADLLLRYDTSVLTCNSWTNHSGFTDWSITEQVRGEIIFHGQVDTGSAALNLPDSSNLFTLHCKYISGSCGLQWKTANGSCAYKGEPPDFPLLGDAPDSLFYINGAVFSMVGVERKDIKKLDLRFSLNQGNGSGKAIWHAPFAGNYSIYISDMQGRIVKSINNIIVIAGNHSDEITLNHLSPGIYQLVILLKSSDDEIFNSIKFAYL